MTTFILTFILIPEFFTQIYQYQHLIVDDRSALMVMCVRFNLLASGVHVYANQFEANPHILEAETSNV